MSLPRRTGRDRRARAFLLVSGVAFGAAFALPLLIAPLTWAGWFGWSTGSASELTVYFGRCLGAMATALTGMALCAAWAPRRHRPLFWLIVWATVLLAGVHLWGLVRDRQPSIEDLEVLLYAGVALAAWLCMPEPEGAGPAG